jgi:5'/3'-nucleotidase SurE
VGSNVGIQVPFSGTVGAAVHAVKNARIPAIAFSGKSANHAAWNEEPPLSAKIYAELALNVTTTVLESGTPYLPAGVWLNVNFPEVSDRRCNDPKQFKYVLSRINKAGFLSSDDVEWCGSERLPEESDVVKEEGCYASISVGDANDKTTADGERQAEVLEKLKPILSCLPIRDD